MKRKYRLHAHLRELLVLDEPPERTARTYGLGVFLGFSPMYGLHTLIAILIIVSLKVNRLAILAGVYSNTPWTMVPGITLGTGIGCWLLGIDSDLPELSKRAVLTGRLWRELLADVETLLLPFFVGNMILAAVLGFSAYLFAKQLLLRFKADRDAGEGVGEMDGLRHR